MLVLCAVPVVSQDGFKAECHMGADDVVMVDVQKVPDLEQSCYEVSYENQKGHLCVWAGGTPDRACGYTMRFNAEDVGEDGWTGRNGSLRYATENCFAVLCRRLVSLSAGMSRP